MKDSPTSSIRNKPVRLILALGALTLLLAALSLAVGAVHVPLGEVLSALFGGGDSVIVLYARAPRVCACLLAGGALAVSGALTQSVLANPLAAPSTIGVNSGAGLAAALCCALAPSATALVPVAAFLGGLLAALLVLFIAGKTGASRLTLVLAGVAISNVLSAGVDAVVTFFPDALAAYSDFRIGSLANLTMQRLAMPAVIIAAALAAALSLTNELDVLTLGADTASSLGMNAKRTRVILLAVAAALAGAAVSFAGLLGFVGLIAPHIVRRFTGDEARFLLPASCLCGASLLLLCDLLSRTLFRPYELPVGIALAFTGGPFFIYLLLRQRKGRTA